MRQTLFCIPEMGRWIEHVCSFLMCFQKIKGSSSEQSMRDSLIHQNIYIYIVQSWHLKTFPAPLGLKTITKITLFSLKCTFMYYLFINAVKYNSEEPFWCKQCSQDQNSQVMLQCSQHTKYARCLFYFTSIEILSDLRLEKCGPLAGHINLTYDHTIFSME